MTHSRDSSSSAEMRTWAAKSSGCPSSDGVCVVPKPIAFAGDAVHHAVAQMDERIRALRIMWFLCRGSLSVTPCYLGCFPPLLRALGVTQFLE